MTFTARIVACVIAGLAAVSAADAAPSRQTITCPYANDPDQHLTIVAPTRIGDLPPIDFDYPAKATRFSFRDGHLLVIAMDQEERSRVRIVISAQLNKATGTYDGQIVLDLGGHQIMMQEGPVRCAVGR